LTYYKALLNKIEVFQWVNMHFLTAAGLRDGGVKAKPPVASKIGGGVALAAVRRRLRHSQLQQGGRVCGICGFANINRSW
jgi:hypothetical protein